ncbi:(2Fe-2S)-binding protein [Neobacillus sp. PS2-9]|uniref:(2Fe-2S)-binding protein n=1 Tax=Neobacillus sp. PS2-9 TaxID=3070676 RepID=UPI0027DEDD61|nr:(2Fe-2S)-binding protein [Neobacillus sp. PS2-9]WML60379.1 (2Fe-2S)-binding protein [Neobacillus sp. PS2-9]
MRIDHPLFGNKSRKTVSFSFNNEIYKGMKGDTIGVALWANGVKTLRHSEKNNEPRGMYCGIGQCYECRIYRSDIGLVKACTTLIKEGEKYYSLEE